MTDRRASLWKAAVHAFRMLKRQTPSSLPLASSVSPVFAEKMREIDHGQRIGAGNIESSSDRQARQGTASPQDRHRAFEAA